MLRFRDLFQIPNRRSRPRRSRRRRNDSYSTSGDQHAHVPHAHLSDEYCNSFWGEAGYEKILHRVKTSDRVLTELKNWYKQRAAIEADYSKQLARLSKVNLFRAIGLEYGGINHSLECIREVTARSAHSHSELSRSFKKELELSAAKFIAKRDGARKNSSTVISPLIEKLHKKLIELQQLQEKARSKFEVDSIAVNGYGAQLHLVEGREKDRIGVKFDKASASISSTEKQYRVLTNNLEETSQEWTLQWKTFCDLIQDLEEDRIDFIQSSICTYTDSLSAVSLLEDAQCHLVRDAVEKCDTQTDIKKFIAQSGTGATLYCAPAYIDYAKGEHEETLGIRAHSQQKTANFTRNSSRITREPPTDTSRLVEELVQSIENGPGLQHASIQFRGSQSRVEDGRNIADMITSNSMASNIGYGMREVQPHSPLSYERAYTHDPRHHEAFTGHGILINR
ncbi:uncharacterized protein MELLADRAFT_94329 [Melampsora larici-populina 98AG31]|uniref:F-BAR domain-containing protein n=1 Tax=Melampsora larici-populina (strain 98AG31 / pathotype 3-4-7) TaxID=747676 RepID=F4S7B5_MELLP|nr:uncharacterized protein MELLADRAFT_94329 [Melampsora larici-populina 98AG31]EGF99490.1 hypothetical protein MELLADRAFT_94329 [Melampsora larici-populina 98AG31]